MSSAYREALEPFAKVARWLADDVHDEETIWPGILGNSRLKDEAPPMPTVGDLRRARTALETIPSEGTVKVRALEWGETADSQYRSFDFFGAWIAPGIGGYYRLEERLNGRFDVLFPGEDKAHRLPTEDEAKAAAQADYERRVLACLAPVAVEEADTKAGEPGDYVLVPRVPTEAMLRAGWELADFNPLRNGYVGQVYRAMLAAAPSTPSPQIGRAGAGPVGEAVAWRRRLKPEFNSGRSGFWEYREKQPLADPHLYEIEPLYAHPVDEPGEVERDSDEESYQIGKRDGYEEAVQHIDERTGGDGEYVAVVGGDPEGRNCPDAPSMIAKIVARFEAAVEEISRQTVARGEEGLRAETAEHAVAETRERLENLLEAMTSSEVGEIGRNLAIKDARNTLRALTGDAQEAGR